MYNQVDYDFTNFVVLQCLGHVLTSAHEEQYICALCDKRLKETSNETQFYHIMESIQKQLRSKLSESTESKT